MKKHAISKEDVKTAIQSLVAEGKKVTQRSLLDLLGRGSFSTIAKYLAEIEAEEINHANSPAVRELLGKLWEQAVAGAAKGYEEQLRTSQAKLEDTIGELQKVEATLTRMEAEKNSLQGQKDELISAVTKGNEETDRLRTKANEAVHRLNEGEQELAKLRSELSQERLVHASAVSALEQKCTTHNEKSAALEIDAARVQSKLEHQALRAENEKTTALASLGQAQQRLNEVLAENTQLRERLEDERNKTDALRTDYAARTDALHAKFDRVQSERLELERSHARSLSELQETIRRTLDDSTHREEHSSSRVRENESEQGKRPSKRSQGPRSSPGPNDPAPP